MQIPALQKLLADRGRTLDSTQLVEQFVDLLETFPAQDQQMLIDWGTFWKLEKQIDTLWDNS